MRELEMRAGLRTEGRGHARKYFVLCILHSLLCRYMHIAQYILWYCM
jgi:hypothetical protein